ncbi:hypothetical protein FA13DRAFT_1812610 [Coprinellus micaceus]|uniref:DUF7918 domain-containing protein n=1 Tax=Coprinellus micaceus TaxID=71717 RepID=A0A4Y7THD9_COPMI|nr:hypothetical protein FA13DRAFT_1812610 [Coprinellus micaceus]
MPVSPHGFEAWIEVEGRRLEEFRAESEGDKLVCWIPCEAGKDFAIGCSVPLYRLRTTNHSIFAYLDGTSASLISNVVRQNLFTGYPETRLFSEELVKGAHATRAFQFGSLELTDDDTFLHAPAKQFGEITVTFNSVQAYVETTTDAVKGSTWKDYYRAHERSKKGVSHCVKLGEEKPRAAGVKHNKAIGAQKVCTIVFKYRQMDVLVADGIAPRREHSTRTNAAASSSTSAPQGAIGPSSGKRKMNEVKEEDQIARNLLDPTDHDIERMENELAAMKAKKAQGGSNGSQPSAKRVKQEHKHAFIPGEIIDLTNLPSGSGTRVKQEPKASFHGEVIDLT